MLRPTSCGGAGEGQAPTVRACPDPATRIALLRRQPGLLHRDLHHPRRRVRLPRPRVGHHGRRATDPTRSRRPPATTPSSGPSVSTTPRPSRRLGRSTDGRRYRGAFTLDADGHRRRRRRLRAAAGHARRRGGRPPARRPRRSTSRPASHELAVTARDEVGNETTRTITFTTADEQPTSELGGPDDDANVEPGDVDALRDASTRPEGDALTVRFREGHTFVPDDADGRGYGGAPASTPAADRAGKVALTGEELAESPATDGSGPARSPRTAAPTSCSRCDVPADAGADATARISLDRVGQRRREGAALRPRRRRRRVGGGRRRLRSTDGRRHVRARGDGPGDGPRRRRRDHRARAALGGLRRRGPQSTRGSTPATPYHPQAHPALGLRLHDRLGVRHPVLQRDQDWLRAPAGDQPVPPRPARRPEPPVRHPHRRHRQRRRTQQYQWKNADPAYRPSTTPAAVRRARRQPRRRAPREDYSDFSQWFGEDRYETTPGTAGRTRTTAATTT